MSSSLYGRLCDECAQVLKGCDDIVNHRLSRAAYDAWMLYLHTFAPGHEIPFYHTTALINAHTPFVESQGIYMAAQMIRRLCDPAR